MTKTQDNHPGGPNAPKTRKSRNPLILAIATAAIVFGALTTAAVSGGSFSHAGGWYKGMHRTITTAMAEKFAVRMVKHVAIEIDATDDQTKKLVEIAGKLVKDVMPVRDSMRDGREKLKALLTQPTVDRAAIEALRAEKVAQMDTVSKRVTDAIGEAAAILTVEQRQKLSDMIAKHRRHRRGKWYRGGWHRD